MAIKKKIENIKLGRFQDLCINAKDFYKLAEELLKKNKYALVKAGQNKDNKKNFFVILLFLIKYSPKSGKFNLFKPIVCLDLIAPNLKI